MSLDQNLALLMLFLLGLLGLSWWLKHTKQHKPLLGTPLMKTIAIMPLGQKEKIVLMELGDTWLILGMTAHSINTLHTLPKGSIPLPTPPMAPQTLIKLLNKLKKQA